MKLAPFMEKHGVGWGDIQSANHVKEWQKMLLSLTLLSKKFKVAEFLSHEQQHVHCKVVQLRHHGGRQ